VRTEIGEVTAQVSRDQVGVFEPFQDVADARGVSPQQIALAWELSLARIGRAA